MNNSYDEVDKWSDIGDNWNSYGSPAPLQIAQDNAKVWLDKCSEGGLKVDRVLPSAEGGITLVFFGSREQEWLQADIECFNDGETLAALVWNHKLTQVLAMDLSEDEEYFFETIRRQQNEVQS